MTIDRALSWFKWRLTNGKQFSPNKKDAEAYNRIAEYVTQSKMEAFQSSELYSRLYIWAFRQFLQHYDAPITNPIPQRELHKVIDKPAAQHVKEFTDFLNEKEMYSAFDMSGSEGWMHLHDDHLREVLSKDGRSAEEIDEALERLKTKRDAFRGNLEEFLADNPKIEQLMYRGQRVWGYEVVAENLRDQIVKSIEQY